MLYPHSMAKTGALSSAPSRISKWSYTQFSWFSIYRLYSTDLVKISRDLVKISRDLVKISRDLVKTSTFESNQTNKQTNKKKEKEQLDNIHVWHLNTLPPEHPKRGLILLDQPSFYAVYLVNDWIQSYTATQMMLLWRATFGKLFEMFMNRSEY